MTPQPIETAPKNASILVAGGHYWCTRYADPLCEQRVAVIARWNESGGRWQVSHTTDYVTATHWWPIPCL